MTSMTNYTRHKIYPHDMMEAVKAVVAPVRAKIVRRGADDIVESQIKTLLANRLRNLQNPESEEKMGLVIYGQSGAGKSSIVRNRVATEPLLASMAGNPEYRFVSVKFRSPVRISTAGHSVVQQLGLPGAVFNERKDYWAEVLLRVAALGTCILHFDETQDAFRQNRAVAHVWMQTFKTLMTSSSPVVLVLTGTNEMKQYFDNEDAQGPRRMVEVSLPKVTYPTDAEGVRIQMNAYCKLLGLSNGLKSTDYERLMRASAYEFGRTLTLGLNGIQEAMLAKSQSLQLMHLAHAFERDKPSTMPAHNFFWAPDYLKVSPFGKAYAGAGNPSPKRKSVKRELTKW